MKKQNNNKKVSKGLKEWMEKNTELLVNLYGIGSVTINFHEGKGAEKSKEGSTAFRIVYSKAYKTANISVYPIVGELYAKKDFKQLTQALTHEIAHILTTPLSNLAFERHVSKKEIEVETEAMTETISQLGRKLLEAKGIKMT